MRLLLFFSHLQNLLVEGLFKEAEDSEGFIECKTSGPPASRSSLRKPVRAELVGKLLSLSVRESPAREHDRKHW